MDFFQNGVRRLDISGAEVYEGSIDQLKEQGLLHGTFGSKYAVVTAIYDPVDKKKIDFFFSEEDAIERIIQIERREPGLNDMCRDCENLGRVCHGSYNKLYSGCLMKHMSPEEFTEYNDSIREPGVKTREEEED